MFVPMSNMNGTNVSSHVLERLTEEWDALTPEAQVGDYVIVHTGFAISVLDQEEAQETLKLFDEIAAVEQSELAGSLGSEAG